MKGGDGAVVTAKMDVGAAATSLIWAARHQVMETGSDLGFETTAGELPMNL
jgi:hypothetical protein